MKLSKTHVLILILGLITAIAGGYLVLSRYRSNENSLIQHYKDSRDRHDVIELFRKDWDWLVAGRSYSQGYVEDMLDKRTPRQNLLHIGALRFRVLRIDNKVVGFTAFYMKEKHLGWLLFLVIDAQYRSKGYADLMTKDAITELQKMGATKVQLLTRSTNVKAQRVYRRLGFEEYAYDPNGFVYFEITP